MQEAESLSLSGSSGADYCGGVGTGSTIIIRVSLSPSRPTETFANNVIFVSAEVWGDILILGTTALAN